VNIANLENRALPVNVVFGRQLARQLLRLSAHARSRLAHDLVVGEVVLRDPTRSQMARLVGVSERSVAEIARSLGTANKRPDMSDAAVERLISRIGAERIWTALDHLTAPAGNEKAP